MSFRDIHSHKCPKQGCGKLWTHDGGALQKNCTEDEFKKEHSCPACGTVQWWKHDSPATHCDMPGIWQSEDQHSLPPMPRGLAQLFGFLTEKDHSDDDGPGNKGDWL